MADVNTQSGFKQLETTLNEYFGKKAPALPAGLKEIIVKVAPWLTVIGILFAIPALLALLGLGGLVGVLSPLGGLEGIHAGVSYTIGLLLLVAAVILEGLAIPGLFARSKKGWTYIFYSQLVSAVSSLLTGGIIGAVIGLIIGLYLIFQVREYYK